MIMLATYSLAVYEFRLPSPIVVGAAFGRNFFTRLSRDGG